MTELSIFLIDALFKAHHYETPFSIRTYLCCNIFISKSQSVWGECHCKCEFAYIIDTYFDTVEAKLGSHVIFCRYCNEDRCIIVCRWVTSVKKSPDVALFFCSVSEWVTEWQATWGSPKFVIGICMTVRLSDNIVILVNENLNVTFLRAECIPWFELQLGFIHKIPETLLKS